MPEKHITYFELPCTQTGASKAFYAEAFGWTFRDFGEQYAEISGAGLTGGLNAITGEERPKAPLLIIETKELEQMLEKVQTAGGIITVPIFAYPGGRRFHFSDPGGNELAVFEPAQ